MIRQQSLFDLKEFAELKKVNGGFRDPSSLENKSLPVHRWTTWIAGFSARFVQDAIETRLPQLDGQTCILDPFAGVGTTLVEAQRYGSDAVGFEINPFATLVSRVKLNCVFLDVGELRYRIQQYNAFMDDVEKEIDRAFLAAGATGEIKGALIPESHPPRQFHSRIPFFSPAVECKVLFSLDFIHSLENRYIADFFRVALGSVMVSVSNYSYEPSLGSRPGAGKDLIRNAPLCRVLSDKLGEMADDVEWFQREVSQFARTPRATVYEKSFLDALDILPLESVDLVITSPPYLNNYHYVRNTRPQLYWLDLITGPKKLKVLEESNFGKYWQTVRQSSPINLTFEAPELQALVDRIRSIKPDKGQYGGPGWANYVASYLNDVNEFSHTLGEVLKPGGMAIIVIGNSIIQGVEVKVDTCFSQVAERHGLATEGIYIIREKRVGSSIVNTGVREKARKKVKLYDAAVVLTK